MFMSISGKRMVIFLTVFAPLLFLLAALLVKPSIWIIMMAMIWLGVGLTMLYIPRYER